MHLSVPAIVNEVAARFSELPQVESVVLGGSFAGSVADDLSDVDLYILMRSEIDVDERRHIARMYSASPEIDNQSFGTEDGWQDRTTGITFDLIYWSTDWLQDQLDRVILRHEGSVGYSTCFWYTVLQAMPLHDRSEWFDSLQSSAQVPYPEQLRDRIVALNHPLLRASKSSFLRQIELAQHRRDLVAVQHRSSAFLASYFDTLFALNHLPHPGEKRLVETALRTCQIRSESMEPLIEALLTATPLSNRVIECANLLTDDLERLLRAEHLIE